MIKPSLIGYAALVLLAAGCGGGQSGLSTANAKPAPAPMSVHTRVFKDYAYTGPPMQKILVFGVFADPALQRAVEDGFSARLKEKGPTVAVAHKIFPSGEQLTRELIASNLADLGIDGVLVAKLKGAQTVETETLRTNAPEDGGGAAGRLTGSGSDFYGYYSSSYQTAAEPGFATQTVQYDIEVKLFEVKDGNPVWEASQTVDNPSTRSEIIARLAEMTAENLANQGILGKAATDADTDASTQE